MNRKSGFVLRSVGIVAVALVAAFASGCNTVEGLGEDLKAGADAGRDAIQSD